MHQWTANEKKQLLTDIRVIKRLYSRDIEPSEIADMMETDYESVELIIQLIDDGFYSSDLELMEAAIILMTSTPDQE
ncbi:MAG TPA: hypothetical protein IAC14_05710 [Candidatus Scybalomonas excrementigallinarum]|nr:hypothetical protein [Candidatus Scybalomonas excrementigallinarum]